MTTAIVSALLVGQQLTSISSKIDFKYPGGLLNSQGTHLFATLHVSRTNLQSGKWKYDGWFRAAIHRGTPPIAVSRTENQAHYDTENLFYGPHVVGDHNGLRECDVLDAIGENRILACGETRLGADSPEYLVLTEIKAEFRRGNPNHSWLLILPVKSWARLGSARFVDDKTVELWVAVRRGFKWSFEKYLGSRGGDSQGLKLVASVPLKNFPDCSIVCNTWNPIEKSFVATGSTSSDFNLYNSDGKVLRSYNPPQTGTPEGNRFIGETQAVWELIIHDSKVPGGKKNWIPFARAANSKIWLVKSKSRNEFKILRMPK